MKLRFLAIVRRWADAVSRRCAEIEFRDTMKRRNEDGAHWVGALVLAIVAVTVGGCVPGGGMPGIAGALAASALAAFAGFVITISETSPFASSVDRIHHRGFAAVVVILAMVLVAGCHGAERATRTALDVTAHAVAATDTVVAREYADAAHRELDAATDLDDYHRRMRRWDRAESALRAVAQALYAAEAGVDAADATSTRGALACVYTAAVDLLGALSALDVPIPQALTRAVDTLGAFVGECHPPEAATPAGGTP